MVLWGAAFSPPRHLSAYSPSTLHSWSGFERRIWRIYFQVFRNSGDGHGSEFVRVIIPYLALLLTFFISSYVFVCLLSRSTAYLGGVVVVIRSGWCGLFRGCGGGGFMWWYMGLIWFGLDGGWWIILDSNFVLERFTDWSWLGVEVCDFVVFDVGDFFWRPPMLIRSFFVVALFYFAFWGW
jgi:hypothetical protein